MKWLAQAEFDLNSARINFEAQIYAYACFMCEQSIPQDIQMQLPLPQSHISPLQRKKPKKQ
ncbi:HEPN domain-containing protein [Candidatus Kryptonium thompsonii]|uniref:HEPN domain-containing protein n=1 Tax=Candidatus Kryptonium thompsonii TaxID=1633631 RepID=UPI00063E7CEE